MFRFKADSFIFCGLLKKFNLLDFWNDSLIGVVGFSLSLQVLTSTVYKLKLKTTVENSCIATYTYLVFSSILHFLKFSILVPLPKHLYWESYNGNRFDLLETITMIMIQWCAKKVPCEKKSITNLLNLFRNFLIFCI